MKDIKLTYSIKVSVPRKAVLNIVQSAYDSKIVAHFKFTKTLSRLGNFQGGHDVQDMNNYIVKCMGCQYCKESNAKNLTSPETLKFSE